MIDASYFSSSYNAFWNEHVPACESFIRYVNVHGVIKYVNGIFSDEKLRRPQFIAEYAFSVFSQRVSAGLRKSSVGEADLAKKAYEETIKRISSYGNKANLRRRLSKYEIYELFEIDQNLQAFFDFKFDGILTRPLFKGCGYIDQSEGDLIHNKTLYEIKTVDRSFRGVDIKQLITYAALNFSSQQFDIDSIGIINPRRGVFCRYSIDSVCSELSGLPNRGLLELISSVVSNGQSSR